MLFNKRRKQIKQIEQDIDSLLHYKRVLSNVNNLYSALEFLDKQFDMTFYCLNKLNRSLMVFTGDTTCLKREIENLESLYLKYLEDKKLQIEKLNSFNITMEENNKKTTSLITDNSKFIYYYHFEINKIQEESHSIADKILYLGNTKNNTNMVSARYLSYKTFEILENNLQKYSELFTFENIFRQYILKKYNTQFNTTDLNQWLKQSHFDNYSARKNEESKFGISSRGDSIIYYLDFDVFADIIENHFKEGFHEDFKRKDDIVNKLRYLYLVRCKIAHNSLCVTEDEYKISLDYITIILNHITTKYKDLGSI